MTALASAIIAEFVQASEQQLQPPRPKTELEMPVRGRLARDLQARTNRGSGEVTEKVYWKRLRALQLKSELVALQMLVVPAEASADLCSRSRSQSCNSYVEA